MTADYREFWKRNLFYLKKIIFVLCKLVFHVIEGAIELRHQNYF